MVMRGGLVGVWEIKLCARFVYMIMSKVKDNYCQISCLFNF